MFARVTGPLCEQEGDLGVGGGYVMNVLDENLQTAGFRPTRQRRAVFECLAGMRNHPTAEEVFASVRHDLPHISLATVYKALESLAVAGMACKLGGGQGSARYDARMDEHYHARCRSCGTVLDIEPNDATSAALHTLLHPLAEVDRVRIEFVGVCEHCWPAMRFGTSSVTCH